ncbi:MAG TPA: ABC transporter permease [Solirubrobacteraceae bacterium]|nr:ABC transporter permease [Solirubrobacteraceae bacterium]
MLVAAIALLLFLILVQHGLQNGLINAFIGAIDRQSAPVLVYSVDGQRTLQGSVITPGLQHAIQRTGGVGESGRIGQSTFTARISGGAKTSVALFGYEKASVGGPDRLTAGRMPRAPGEAVGSDGDFALGETVRQAGAASAPVLRVVGLAGDAEIQVLPTLFVSWSDYGSWVRAANPDARAVLPSAIGVRPSAGTTPDSLVRRINAVSPEADALTRADAAQKTPGVSSVRNSFTVIFLLFAGVVPLVAGLFFLIVTLQKARALTLLRAIGAPARRLVGSLLVQALIVLGAGIVLGTLMWLPLSQATVGQLSLTFDAGNVLFWAGILLALGLTSALVAARRVLAIDPVEATTGGGGL